MTETSPTAAADERAVDPYDESGPERDYRATNGHTLRYFTHGVTGQIAKRAATEAWHSPNCPCGGRESLPDW